MKAILIILALLLVPAVAFAGPFLVSDPNPSAVGGYSDITGGAWVPNPVNVQADGSVRVDMATAPVGPTTLQVRVCKNDAVWGTLCSPFVPYNLLRPAAPSAASGMGLVP